MEEEALIARPLSPSGLHLIADFESGGRAYYDRFGAHPNWPGASSGVTIAFGFDLGFRSRQELDTAFSAILSATERDRLATAIGTNAGQGEDALAHIRKLLKDLADIVVTYDQATAMFTSFEVPVQSALTARTFPNTEALSPDSFSALVSLVFNRGTSLRGGSRVEMKEIHDLMDAKRFAEIPERILAMKRLWGKTSGLQRRRDAEAALFNAGLGQRA